MHATGTGVALANAATSVRCDRRAEVQHLHTNEMGSKGQLFDAVSVMTKKAAAYRNVLINVGGETARVNFQATLNGTLGNVEVRGWLVGCVGWGGGCGCGCGHWFYNFIM